MLLINKSTTFEPVGDMSRMFGFSNREARQTDKDGLYPWESALADRYNAIYKHSFRYPAGSNSYNVSNINDPKVQFFFDTVEPLLPAGVEHEFTYGPQLPPDQIPAWVTARTAKIIIGGNEPPLHIGPTKEFGSEVDYYNLAVIQYNLHPSLQSKMWVQSGKPEVVRYGVAYLGLNANQVNIHQACLTELKARITAGDLPARVATTHKLSSGYFNIPGMSDAYVFYNQLLDDYATQLGTSSFEIGFTEYNDKGSIDNTIEEAVLCAEFWCVMSRIRHERGNQVYSGHFHQGYAAGPNNLFGLQSAGNQVWVTSATTEIWELFTSIITVGQYMETTVDGKPDDVQVEIFKVGATNYLLYSNRGTAKITLHPGLKGTTINYVDSGLIAKQETYANELPPMSAGVIALQNDPIVQFPFPRIFRYGINGSYFEPNTYLP